MKHFTYSRKIQKEGAGLVPLDVLKKMLKKHLLEAFDAGYLGLQGHSLTI